MQPQDGSVSDADQSHLNNSTTQPTGTELGSRPVVYEPVPLPGERPNVAPANVPHDVLPPLPPKPASASTPPIQSPSSQVGPQPAIGTTPYQSVPPMPSSPSSKVSQAQPQPASVPSTLITRFKKPLIIVAGLFIALLVVGIITKATSKKSGSGKPNSSNNAQNQNSGPVATAPDGYKVIDRPCFSFAILDTNLSIGSDNVCFVIARYGEKGISSLNVYPETKTYSSLDDFSAAKKKEYNSQVVSEDTTKIDGLDAKKIIETVGPSGQQYVRYYVLTTGKEYKYQQTAITGFEINSFFNDDFSRQVTEKIITSWKWK